MVDKKGEAVKNCCCKWTGHEPGCPAASSIVFPYRAEDCGPSDQFTKGWNAALEAAAAEVAGMDLPTPEFGSCCVDLVNEIADKIRDMKTVIHKRTI